MNFNPSRSEEICRLYLRGMGIGAIAKKLNVSERTVSRYLSEAKKDWKSRSQQKIAELRSEFVAALLDLKVEAWELYDAIPDDFKTKNACLKLILEITKQHQNLLGIDGFRERFYSDESLNQQQQLDLIVESIQLARASQEYKTALEKLQSGMLDNPITREDEADMTFEEWEKSD